LTKVHIYNLKKDFPFLNAGIENHINNKQRRIHETSEHGLLAGSALFGREDLQVAQYPRRSIDEGVNIVRSAPPRSPVRPTRSERIPLFAARKGRIGELPRCSQQIKEKEQASQCYCEPKPMANWRQHSPRGDADKKEATQAIERVQQLRQDNQLPREREVTYETHNIFHHYRMRGLLMSCASVPPKELITHVRLTNMQMRVKRHN